ncbi:MAG: hypothetical protein LBD14_03305 [Puniceicoccales bacterium]|jgi:hypothetical protein|nr:hypothetical protein [Puniceicoccales bacterium]
MNKSHQKRLWKLLAMFVATLALGVCGGVVRGNATAASANGTDLVCVDRQSTRIASPPVFEGGTPSIAAVFGTSLYYATNTPAAVLKTPDETWFVCENGVWFMADNAHGPWRVAAALPSDIGRIPQGHVLHFLTFARFREYDGRHVWFEIAPGYYAAPPPPPVPAPAPTSVSVSHTYAVTPVFLPWGDYQWGVGVGMGCWGVSHSTYYGARWTTVYYAPIFYSRPLIVWYHALRPPVVYRHPYYARRWVATRPAPLLRPRPVHVVTPRPSPPRHEVVVRPVPPRAPVQRPVPPPRPVARPTPPPSVGGGRPFPPSRPVERPAPPNKGERPTPPNKAERPMLPSRPVERPTPPRGESSPSAVRTGKERDAK